MDWGAAALQVALFSKGTPFPSSLDLYRVLFGADPDLNEERPKEGSRRQLGQIGNVQAQVGITPLRIDIVLSPVQTASLDLDAALPTSMGEFGAEADKFEACVSKLFSKFDAALVRVAFVAVAIAPATSRENAYGILANSVRSLKITPSMRDLIYRVNWTAPTSRLKEGFLNRLTTWSSFKLTASASFVGQRGEVQLAERDFARIDMDYNTPAERVDALPQSELVGVFQELVALAKKTVANGEQL